MKKFLAFVMAASMALSLAACGGSTPASSTASTTTEATSEAAASTSGSKTDVAFVTDVGNIDDQSFNQYTWQGVQDFCSANSLNANYYRPTEDSDAARLEQMDNAVNDGAKSIVVAGYLFGSAVAEAQEKYPDVQFLALDVSTADLGDKAPTSNTALITYKEEQAGYLAGYAAVYDGYKELGFLGGMAVPAVNCVGLPMSTSKFTKFTQEQYDTMYAAIVDGSLVIDDSFDADVHPAVTNVTVDYQS